MSSLQFKDYFLNEVSYRKNPNFDQTNSTINLQPELSAQILIKKSENLAYVNLVTKQGNINFEDSAFEIIVDIVGEFTFTLDETEFDIDFETSLKENAVIPVLFLNVLTCCLIFLPALVFSFLRPVIGGTYCQNLCMKMIMRLAGATFTHKKRSKKKYRYPIDLGSGYRFMRWNNRLIWRSWRMACTEPIYS